MATILAVHGPNLNLLGSREPQHYGSDSLASINRELAALCVRHDHEFQCFQSNFEGELIERLHQARGKADYMLFNGGGLTHTSVALRDAVIVSEIPFVEVHVSNLFKREPFRHASYFSDLAVGCVVGLGAQGYTLALQFAIRALASSHDRSHADSSQEA